MRSWMTPGLLKGEKEIEALQVARRKGFLRDFGDEYCYTRLGEAWFLDRRAEDLPFVVSTCHYWNRRSEAGAYISVDLFGSWWMTRRLLAVLKVETNQEECFYHDGSRFVLSGVKTTSLDSRSFEILELLHAHKPTEAERYDAPPRLVEGCFKCHLAQCFEEDLVEGETYFLREMPGRLGHVTVYIPGRAPLVGIHLDRFEV